MIEQYSYYQFEIEREHAKGQTDVGENGYAYVYRIDEGNGNYIESQQWFDTEDEARANTIEHIKQLERDR